MSERKVRLTPEQDACIEKMPWIARRGPPGLRSCSMRRRRNDRREASVKRAVYVLFYRQAARD